MPSSPVERAAPAVTGIGVATGFGYGKDSLLEGLFSGRDLFAPLTRPGRQSPSGDSGFIGIEMPEPPEILPKRVARTAGLSARVAVAVVQEAWTEAGLDKLDPSRIGLVLGGSNLQNRELLLAQRDLERRGFVSPHLGYAFFDTDIAALCAATFGIRGVTYSVGGASASGAVAVIHAAEMVARGHVDACIAVGALQDLSFLELEALKVMGALGPREPGTLACRPFDRGHDGFVFGESCAALVVRRGDAVPASEGYGRITGYAHIADGHRGPDPSWKVSCAPSVPRWTWQRSNLKRSITSTPMAPGTPLGDETEVAAYRAAGLRVPRSTPQSRSSVTASPRPELSRWP